MFNSPFDLKEKYFDYHPSLEIKSSFITTRDITEVSNIISSLQQGKINGPNSIPTRIQKFVNENISEQLAFLFNKPFSSQLFPLILKTRKITSTEKKDSKLGCSETVDQFYYSPVLTKFW